MKIIARFQPQAWQRDNAIDVDAEGEIEWDVTEEILAMGREKALALEDNQYETDELRESKNAPEWVRDWSGPFYINVADSIAAYFNDDPKGVGADAILKDLIETIEATGGVIKNQDGTIAPVGDEDWIDLGSVYESACGHLGREMKRRPSARSGFWSWRQYEMQMEFPPEKDREQAHTLLALGVEYQIAVALAAARVDGAVVAQEQSGAVEGKLREALDDATDLFDLLAVEVQAAGLVKMAVQLQQAHRDADYALALPASAALVAQQEREKALRDAKETAERERDAEIARCKAEAENVRRR